jgi:hypothetical protein
MIEPTISPLLDVWGALNLHYNLALKLSPSN